VKAGVDYEVMEGWHAGADAVYVSSQFFVGDESNQNKQIPGYAVFNLHTSYDINKHVQIYGIIDNLFDNHYALYGTYFQSSQTSFTDPRTETPATPFAAYGGVRIKF
jgi:iron complex outermembrane receptor protein